MTVEWGIVEDTRKIQEMHTGKIEERNAVHDRGTISVLSTNLKEHIEMTGEKGLR